VDKYIANPIDNSTTKMDLQPLHIISMQHHLSELHVEACMLGEGK
jgi:hypothetical protein